MSETEVRKIPKKTVIIIGVLIILAIVGYLLITLSRDAKIKEVLNSLGYTNISKVVVYNVSQVEDKNTRVQSKLFKLSFNNDETKQECFGLINEHNGKFKKEIECK
ncbi:conserved hypothetical protein [Arcobacter nitrofigilis DSM 7299]|uniref:Uncharacterized protein n=1 Tax=Arcobacter nitrofigilis (strain ATCC 33309 / DSM 7299 / CCUG 15893 / LMG 7604 / NCTC 12251 / CI) TaxID=572480 RepID=D5V750_ARCNC|nr:hypothetical protein [Arcobacter nitrofigilis]ADG94470.1 conserved hypothetical protein [Arcobacter nitrofigilis DSM 7299]